MNYLARRYCTSASLLALTAPSVVQAHSFGRLYNLPVPLWMYAYGAMAALALSFLVIGYFAGASGAQSPPRWHALGSTATLHRLRVVQGLRALGVALLLLCIATGYFGSRDAYRNFNMTFFWIVFVLGFAYATALVGDFYATLNPWRTLAMTLGRVWRGFTQGRLRFPVALAYWPALLLYMAFIWIELFAGTRPHSLSQILLGYTALNVVGVWLVGTANWFRYCEFFGVFLRLTAKMAPLVWRDGRVYARLPFSGLAEEPAGHMSLVLFVLFMLSSTAFDGLRATVPWVSLFWQDPTGLVTRWAGTAPVLAYMQLRPVYLAYESLCLLLSPFLYCALYLLFVWLSKRIARSPLPLMELARRFAFSLLPIALVYNVTHYSTLILTQGVKIVSLLSDPFGWGWNLFGTAGLWRAPYLPDMAWVWHSQVALIVLGHIVSVYFAHVEALRAFSSRRAAALSQLPMLILMMLFTTAGLWILAQPIQSG